jgi:hypothetical protein
MTLQYPPETPDWIAPLKPALAYRGRLEVFRLNSESKQDASKTLIYSSTLRLDTKGKQRTEVNHWEKLVHDLEFRDRIAAMRVRDAIRKAFGFNYSIAPFGSAVYRASIAESNIDLCIMVSTPCCQVSCDEAQLRLVGPRISKGFIRINDETASR